MYRVTKLASTAAVLGVAASIWACHEPAAPRATELPRAAALHGLLACPTDQSQVANVTIGPLGASIQFAGHRVEVPAGALLAVHTFEIHVPAGELMEVQVKESLYGSFLFEKPITISIDYRRCSKADNARPLSVWYIDEVTKQPLQYMGGRDDRPGRRITFQTNHLSGFAIAE